MQTNYITRKQAIEKIIKFLALKTYKDVQIAEMLLMTRSNEGLSDLLGYINFVKDNSLEVVNSVIKNSIWNDLIEFRTTEGFFLPRTNDYGKYNDLEIR